MHENKTILIKSIYIFTIYLISNISQQLCNADFIFLIEGNHQRKLSILLLILYDKLDLR